MDIESTRRDHISVGGGDARPSISPPQSFGRGGSGEGSSVNPLH